MGDLYVTLHGILISETIAFHSVLTSYGSMEAEDTVVFDLILLNQGNG